MDDRHDGELKLRLASAEQSAARATESAMQRCRTWSVAIGVVQTALHPGDHVWLGGTAVAVVALTWAVTRWSLASPRVTVAGSGWIAMVGDTVAITAIMLNQLSDATDPIQLLPLILVTEAEVRWGRNGGLLGGLGGGAVATAWAVGADRVAHIPVLFASVTFRLALMVLMGAFIGTVVRQGRNERRTGEAIVIASRDLVASFALDGTIVSVNPACEEILGYRPEDLIGQDRALLMDPADHPGGPPDVDDYRRQGAQRVERCFLHLEGQRVWLELDVLPDLEAGVIHAIGRDVSERRQRESELRHRIDHDDLTGTWTRETLVSYLTRMLAEGHRPGLLFVDVDDFKAVNDTHGHVVGDLVLVELAVRLRRSAGPDGSVARYAGDEFCIAIDDPDDLAADAERAQGALGASFAVAGRRITVSAAVGAARAQLGDSTETLVDRADRAMYAAKAAARLGPKS
ncbi:MAG: diguanylate cyclase domain-containing protein [Acidimicrobiales bacterium]